MLTTDWTAGYVADIGYTFGYYHELQPLRARLAVLNAGFAAPEIKTACELGFGQGVSVNVHAAASDVQWYGTDFNPSQAAFARDLARVAGSGAKLYDDAFADFCARDDLPEFDFIGLHGIWSWISDSNRSVLVDFIRRKLSVGGILYVSYNTLPGWATFAPMRHLLTQHTDVIGASGTAIANRIDEALGFADRLMAIDPAFARANPQIAERLKHVGGQNRSYLAHEYFNRDWHPMHFSTLGDWLGPAKVSFACSAHLLDHIDSVNLTVPQRELLASIPDMGFRQTVRDFIGNTQFRKDLWIKGPRRLSPLEQIEAIRSERVLLTVPGETVSLKIKGGLGEATLNAEVYEPIIKTLANNQILSIGEIEQAVAPANISYAQVAEAVAVLISQGVVAQAQAPATVRKAKPMADRINARLINLARSSNDNNVLASPISGGGVSLSRFQQLFLGARAAGLKKPEQWAQQVWAMLKAQGQKIIKDGAVLEADEENLAELQAEADQLEKRLPGLIALGVVS
jgi:hypothetical protein